MGLFLGSSLNLNAVNFLYNDSCVDYAWKKADELNENYEKLTGRSYSDWDLWDITNAYYESCINDRNKSLNLEHEI